MITLKFEKPKGIIGTTISLQGVCQTRQPGILPIRPDLVYQIWWINLNTRFGGFVPPKQLDGRAIEIRGTTGYSWVGLLFRPNGIQLASIY